MNANRRLISGALVMMVAVLGEPQAGAHGVPIELGVADGSLVVSHVTNEYPSLVIGQFEEESDPQGPFPDPVYGPTLLWDLPGIDITGMAGTASLAIEVLPAELGDATQSLWYWDPVTRAVEPTPPGAVLDLALASGGVVRLTGASGPAAPIELAASVAGETGFHNHGLLNYTMPFSEGLNFGLYGFFARFTSSEYAPSERFLLIFNLGAPYEDLALASEALWLAATPGDYTLDNVVDAADFGAWSSAYGSAPSLVQTHSDGNGDGVVDAADYTLWRDQAAGATVTRTPEPGGAALLLAPLLQSLASRRRKSSEGATKDSPQRVRQSPRK